jgi:hypothetical protein
MVDLHGVSVRPGRYDVVGAARGWSVPPYGDVGEWRGPSSAAVGWGGIMASKDKGGRSAKTAAARSPKEKRDAKREKKAAKGSRGSLQ